MEGDYHHSWVFWVEVWDGMKEVAIGCQQYGIFFDGQIKEDPIQRTFISDLPEIKAAVTTILKELNSRLRKILIEEKPHE